MPVDVTDKYIRVRVRMPGEFEENTFRTIALSAEQGIRAVIGRLKGEDATTVQSYLFDKEKWDVERAEAWVKEHGEEAKAATLRNRLRALLRAAEAILSDKEVPEAVRKELGELRAAINKTWGELADEATAGQEEGEAKGCEVKALYEDADGMVVGGYIALWGDAEHRDLQKDYFTPETWLGLEEYKGVPALFHHGFDPKVGPEVLGHRIDAGLDEVGAWVKDWLNKASEYWEFVRRLLEAKALYYSPGSAPHLVRRAKDGRLVKYPIVEDTLTPQPIQFRLRPVEEIKAVYAAAGLEMPDGLDEEAPAEPGDDASGEAGLEAELLRRDRAARAAALEGLARVRQRRQR